MDIQRTLRKLDDFQQRERWLAFPFAVFRKFGDDRAGNLAVAIAYYGFFSMFPLLLTFVSVLGLILRGHQGLQDSIVHSALRDFPVIGDQIARNVHSISGNGVALAVGIVGTLWAGMGVTQAAQNAMNQIWDVPRKEWPNFLKSRFRGLLMLAILGTLTIGATRMASISSPRKRDLRKFGHSFLGTSQIWFMAFWAAWVTPMPAHRVPTMPTASATPFPEIEWTFLAI